MRNLPKNVQQLLDGISSTRGHILYRGASGWASLSPGTAGYVLATGGAGADPSWALVAPGGAIAFSGCNVYQSATDSGQSLSTSEAEINFDVEEYDTDAYHSNSNKGRFYVPAAGKYRIGAFINLNSVTPTGGYGLLQIKRFNSGDTELERSQFFSAGGVYGVSGILDSLASAGDYFSIRVNVSTGSNATYGDATKLTRAFIERIG